MVALKKRVGLGVVFPDGGLDGPHADLFGRVVLGSHGMCRKKQVNPTWRASPPTRESAGFKPLETIPSVLPWLAVLNKKGRGVASPMEGDRTKSSLGPQLIQ